MTIKISECSFENEQNEKIDYVELILVIDENTTVKLKAFNDDERRKLNGALRKKGYKIGKRKENNT